MKVKFAFAYCAKSDNLADKVASLNHQCLFPDENRPLTVQFSKGCITCYIFNSYLAVLIDIYSTFYHHQIKIHHIPTIPTILISIFLLIYKNKYIL